MTYDVVSLLGRGGSSVVELAVDAEGRPVAVKRVVLTGSAAQIHVARQRLRREAEILGGLAHPGILPIIDVIDDGSDIVLILPALAENLEDRVARLGPLAVGDVERIGRVLIGALAAAHRQGVVHRDIKPANVLFDDAGEPALADFGVAVTRDVTAGLTGAGMVIGTPMWMSPEQARGEPVGPATDVFALGATLVFSLTGRGPYLPGPSSVMMGRASRGEMQPVPVSVPKELREPLQAMIDPRPERRPSAAGVLGGLDGTRAVPAPTKRRLPVPVLVRRLVGRRPESDGGVQRLQRSPGRWVERALMIAIPVAVVAGLAVIVLDRHGARPSPTVAKAPVHTCTPLRYLPCGDATPAPHATATSCDRGWYDLDGVAADGCEAHSTYVPGLPLADDSAVHANLVPTSATDSFTTHVNGSALNLCWGSLHLTLTAPSRTAERLTVWDGHAEVADALSADNSPATATVHKPSCFGADSESLRLQVRVVASSGGASEQNFTLTRSGGW